MKKKLFITMASCLAFACMGGGMLVSASAETETVSLENNGAFYTVPGASVRLGTQTVQGVDMNAMRFTFEMTQAQYEAIVSNGEYKSGASVNAYVILTQNIAEGATAAEVATDADVITTAISADKWTLDDSLIEEATEQVYHACAYVYNLPADMDKYDDDITAFASLTTTDGTVYSSLQSRSMAYVADAALDSGKYADKADTLDAYLPTYDVSFYDEDGVTVLGTSQVKYGNLATATDEVNAALIGENVAEFPRYTATWSEKSGEAWSSESKDLANCTVTGATSYKIAQKLDNGIMTAKLAATSAEHATVNGYNLGGIVTDVADNVVYADGGNTVTARSDGNWFYPFSNTVGTEYSYKTTVHADATYYQARDGVTTYMPGASIATSNADGSSAFAVTAKFAYWEAAGSVVLSISTLGYRTNVVLYGSFADVYASRNADYSNWGDGELNATVEFVKTETNITLYVQGVKMCTMTADGVVLANGVTSNADATLTGDDYKTRLACFFGEGVESVCGIQGESMKTSLDFTYTVEQKAIDGDTIHLTNLAHATVNGYNLGGVVTDVADGITYTNGDGGNTVTARSDGDWFYSFDNTVGTEYSYKVTLHEDDVHYNKLGESTKAYMPGAAIATNSDNDDKAYSVAVKFAYWEGAGKVILSVATLGWRRDISLQASFADVYEKRISADETNGTAGWGDGAFNATVEFVKTTDKLTIYVEDQKLCTMTVNGIVVADGVTCTDSKLTDDTTKTRLAYFFGEGVESVGGIQGEAMDVNLDFEYTVEYKEIDSSKNLMKYDEATGTVVYDGETPATSAQSQWYYLSGSGNSVYLDTTIATDGAADVAQGAEGIVIKVNGVERRILFANSGVYVFTEGDGLYVNGVYTNSGLTDSNGNYAIYQALTTFGKYFDINIEQQTGNVTPYGTWYGVRRYTWGDISACNRVVYIVNDGYLYIALGADASSVTAFLKLDLNCLFNGMITQDTVYKIGYASTGTRYWNNNAPRESGIVENPAYAYKTNEVLFGTEATSKIAQAIAKYSFSDEKHGMTTNASGEIVNDGTLDGSSNYFYLAGSGKTVYLNTDIVTDGWQTRSGGNTQGTDGIIIRVDKTVRRVLFAGSGVYVFTENDGNYVASAGTGAAQYINSGITDSNGTYAIYQSMMAFGKYFDTSVTQLTSHETPYGTWYGDAGKFSYGRLNNTEAMGDVSTNVTYVIDGSYLYIALDGAAYLKLDLNCLFYGLLTEDTVFEVGYASCGNKYGGSNTNQGAQTEVWYSYKTNEILYGDDATAKIAEALTLFNS